MDQSRRDFLKGTAWMGVAAMATEGAAAPLKLSGTTGAPMQGFALKPMHEVRVACVGVGSRGSAALHRIASIPGTRVTVIADLFQDRIDQQVQWLKANGKPAPVKTFAGPEGYKRLCEMEEVDVVYNVTPWHMHAPIAQHAMEHGKVALNEVPGCLTLDECWKLVETSERTKIPCMMLENCCYGEYEMAMFNMVRQGVFGEIVHGEAGYIHDQRNLQYNSRYHTLDGHPDASSAGRPGWALDFYSKHAGNWYPTHGLGPVAKYMDINHGDNFDFLVSLESRQANYHHYGRSLFQDWRKDFQVKMGDMNLSLIRTKLGRSILLEHDVSSPRPYSRLNLISGTRGMAVSYPEFRVALEEKTGDEKTHEYMDKDATDAILEKYRHPFWKVAGEVAKKVGGHGGMDFIMDLRWSYCLQNGLPLDTDAYDLAAWSAMVELTEKSVDSGSRPVDCPDFTRGAWRTAKPFPVDTIDLSKLPGDFSDARQDAQAIQNAKQEGLSK
ncbi:MAG: Gfo/Idh/MocA family oxidoreductase [Kiritimatiellae bacterium]|nr:Gfo/Idh/MocA family oxidoreductase [Kiritimatiellia bacterium]